MDTIARLRNEIYALKLAPPVPLTPATLSQAGLVYDNESPQVQRIDQLGPI